MVSSGQLTFLEDSDTGRVEGLSSGRVVVGIVYDHTVVLSLLLVLIG